MPEKKEKRPWMERYGMRYFAHLSKKSPHEGCTDEIHVLNPAERKALVRVQRNSILRQSFAGAVSAGISVVIGFMLWPRPGDWDAELPWNERIEYYIWLYSLSFFVTSIEIAYLYYDSLRSVHKLSLVAGLELFPEQGEEQGVTVSLVRAALELPNPPDNLEGINPRREISKFRLFLSTMLYKLKATATNFIVKAVMRRVAGRSAFRALMEFVAVPVFAFWNGLIAFWVLRQARIRAMGPSAVKEFSDMIYPEAKGFSEQAHAAAFQAIGAAIVRTVDLHPNLVVFMETTEAWLGHPGEIVLDDSALYIASLGQLPPQEQKFVLKVLVLASILDGKLAFREKKLLKRALETCGFQPDLGRIEELRHAFVRGKDIAKDKLESCLPERS